MNNEDDEILNKKALELEDLKKDSEIKNRYNFSDKSNFKLKFDNSFIQNQNSRNDLELARSYKPKIYNYGFSSAPIVDFQIDRTENAYSNLDNNFIDGIYYENLSSQIFSYQSDTNTFNEAPIDIKISSSSFNENISANSFIGSLSSIDSNLNDSHTYKLINGEGDVDNDLFYLSGNKLFINHMPNYEWKESYSLRISSVDNKGFIHEKIVNLETKDLFDHGRTFFKGNNSLNSTNTWDTFSLTNPYINGLYTGFKWGNVDPDNGGWTDLEFYLASDETIKLYDYGNSLPQGYFQPLSDIERSSYLSIIKSFSDVCKVTFRESDSYDVDKRNILFGSVDMSFWGMAGLVGRANFPDGSKDSGLTTMVSDWFKPHLNSLPNVYGPGSWLYAVAMHELGHSMGLAHPHHAMSGGTFPGVTNGISSMLGDNNLNSGPFTVMTYNFTNAGPYTPGMQNAATHPATCGCPTCLGAFDIAHLQYLYGANPYTNRKDNSYLLSDSLKGIECIWDASGIDQIDASNASKAVTIDLRNATLKNEFGGGGFVSTINGELQGYTIAYNSTGKCIIENAIGSNFGDSITGNEYSNYIYGLSGDDFLYARGGGDFLFGGSGNDSLYGSFHGDVSFAIDTLEGGTGADIFILGSTHSSFYTNSSNSFANIKDFDFTEDKLTLKNGNTYLTSLTSQNNINGLGIYIDKNSSGIVDSGDDLIAVISNKSNYLSIDKINKEFV